VVRMSELVGRRESDLNVVGLKLMYQVQPVRPVVQTGQTGPAQADRSSFDLLIFHVSLNLMIIIKLTTKN